MRLMFITWVLLRHGLDEIVLATHLFRPIRWVVYLRPWHWMRRQDTPRAVRIRRALEDLGPIFVKFGQILSTRRDLLPPDIAEELSKLQDRVPPFPDEMARGIIEKSLGQSIEEVFADFEATPFASASIAQVHGAHLQNGKAVVVKVLRPGIDKVISRDVGLMYIIAELADRYWSDGHRLRPKEVVAEFEKNLFDELDLVREAANASQLRRNFLGSEELYIPEVYWPYIHRDVMVMERISGIPCGNIQQIIDSGIDLQMLAERGVEIFFTQVFRDNFFHADMHPGNIFVAENGQYIAVDFGIVGTLTTEDQRYLAGNLLAFFNRDYRRVAELHVDSGWVPADTRIDEFESAIRAVSEPIFERPIKEISFGHFLLRLFQTARRFNMEVQPQLVLLQKTLLNIEGLGRQIYPDLDLWTTAKPFLERWTREQVGPKAFINRIKDTLPLISETAPELPLVLGEVVRQARTGRLVTQSESQDVRELRRELHESARRQRNTTAGSALLVTAALIPGIPALAVSTAWGLPIMSWVLGVAGGGLLISAWFGGKR